MHCHIKTIRRNFCPHFYLGTQNLNSQLTYFIVSVISWSYLEVYTNGSYDDAKQAYAAGLFEGAATREMIIMHWHNTMKGYCGEPLTPYCKRLKTFLETNFAWVEKMIKENPTDPYWHQVCKLVLSGSKI